MDNFKEENIIFDDVVRLKEYFFYFYDELFYKDSDKVLNKLDNLAEFSFDFHRIKSRSDIDIMIELYKLFEKSLYLRPASNEPSNSYLLEGKSSLRIVYSFSLII